MACITLQPSIQGCVNIPIIQGTDSSFTFTFDPSFPLSDYEVIMDIKQSFSAGVNDKPVFRKTDGYGLEVAGQSITVSFGQEMYKRNWTELAYDMLFVHNSGDYQAHLIVGKIFIKPSITRP